MSVAYSEAELKTFIQRICPDWKTSHIQQIMAAITFEPDFEFFVRLVQVLQQPTEPERSQALFLLGKFSKNPFSVYNGYWFGHLPGIVSLINSPDAEIRQMVENYLAEMQTSDFARTLYSCLHRAGSEGNCIYQLLLRQEWLQLIDMRLQTQLFLKVGTYSLAQFMKYNQSVPQLVGLAVYNDPDVARNARILLSELPDEWLHKYYGSSNSLNYSHYNLINLLVEVAPEDTNLLAKIQLLLSFWQNPVDSWHRNRYCELWAQTRNPRLAVLMIDQKWVAEKPLKLSVLTHLKTDQTQLLPKTNYWEFKYLIEFCADPDPEVATRARQTLLNLPEARFDTLGKIWLDERLLLLEELFAERNYLPAKLPEAQVKLALKLHKEKELLAALQARKANLIAPLVQACEDSDPQIADSARQLLPEVVQNNPSRQVLLCRAILAEEVPFATKLALTQNYYPPDNQEQLLFFFLIHQWERYEALDYEFRALRAAYETGNARLRQRIAAAIRQSGRADYLTIISGGETRLRAEVINQEEAEVIVRNLTSNRDWAKLWELVFELPLHWSVAAVRQLAIAEWQPDRAEDRALLTALQQAAQGELITTEAEAIAQLPPAVLRAQMRLGTETRAGSEATRRITDIAFSAKGSQLGLGLSDKQAVLWDWQSGKLETTITGFRQGLSRLAFLPNNSLICTETGPNWRTPTSVYHWQPYDQQLVKLADHRGAITALQPVDEETILWGAQDRQTVKYNLRSRQVMAAHNEYSTWTRHICLPKDKKWVALFHNGITILNLADFSLIDGVEFSSMNRPNVLAATLSPGETHLLFSRAEKKLGSCELPQPISTLAGFDFRYFGAVRPQENRVVGLASLPNLPLLVAASIQGVIELIDWEKRTTIWTMPTPARKLTTFKLSPDGHFMALADELTGLSLWDLRVLDLQRLFARSLAQGRATHLAALTICEQSETMLQLPAAVKAALRYLRLILERRARFDIELDEVSFIQAGTFDIEL